MKVELLQDLVDEIGPFAVLVYSTEGVPCGLNQQRWYVERLAVRRNSGNPRSDAKADVVELTQPLHHSVDLLGIHPLGIKDRLRIVEDYEDLFRQ